jgi:4a-hydroxytetrahydrobiopterin dehydratase
MSDKLSPAQVNDKLSKLDGWTNKQGSLVKEFVFADFKAAMAFVNRVAGLAELANHHPDIAIVYNKVSLQLSTHSAGGITDKDFDLAAAIDG